MSGAAPRPVGARDHAVGAVLSAAYVAVLVRTAGTLGYSRDEGFYVRAAESYARWFELLARDPRAAVTRGAIDAAWSANHEHPALMKSLFSLSWLFLHKRLHLFAEEGTSFRFGGMVVSSLALWLLYVWGARARSRLTGLAAAALYALMPRVFYHAHLDCFDAPIATLWAFVAYVYWRSLAKGGLAWALATGVAFGLALDTKHNAWFLPFAVVAHTLVVRGRPLVDDLRRGVVRVPGALLAMAVVGPIVFVALWPWIWFDTARRFADYVGFHLGHEYYNMVFLGETYFRPPMPRGYAWLMTAATVPTITLVLFVVGAAVVARERLRRPATQRPDATGTYALWAIGLVVSYAPWLSTGTPIFGGTKHWLTAYPFLCLFAGTGFQAIVAAVASSARSTSARAASVGLAGALMLVAPLVETAHSHPFGLSNYTPLVGGAPGAATLGLNRQFWGFTTGSVASFLDANVPKNGGSVFVHDTSWDAWDVFHRDGRLAPHVAGAWAPHSGTHALYHHEEHMEGVEYQVWAAYGTASPVMVAAYDGVPIVYVYARPRGTERVTP